MNSTDSAIPGPEIAQAGPRHARIVLVGGGHAHVAVLADWIKNGLPCDAPVLVSPSRHLRYSGMVPAWIAGFYEPDEGLVDIAALADRAGIAHVMDRCTLIDPDRRFVELAGAGRIAFDFASLDTGGVGRAREVLGDDPRLLDIRPIDRFVENLAPAQSGATSEARRIVVAGGGAGGTELAFGLRNMAGSQPLPVVTLATGKRGLLPDFTRPVRAMVAAEMAKQGIEVIEGDATIASGELHAAGRSLEPADIIIAALGSAAPRWPGEGGLACDADGFVLVDRHQRSVSHPHVHAVGDVAAREDRRIPHSGVHAVFAGPVLAANLRAALAGKAPPKSYTPRWNNLYLMTTGNGSAIASYGPLAAKGRWVAKLKDWIDRRWIAKYRRLARPD